MPSGAPLPYCGPPPQPAALAASWNLDPALLLALLAVAAAYAWLGRRGRGGGPRDPGARSSFAVGWALLVVAFVSPLCPLGVALFSARLGQHLLLAVVVAPLLVLGTGRAAGPSRRARRHPLPAAVAFALALWLWHAPRAYDLTLRSDAAYWAMHLSLLATSCWLWAEILRPDTASRATAATLAFASSLQMGLLGALLALAPRPLYVAHLATTAPWGLTPLADQALGGLLCWVPGCAALAAAGIARLRPWLERAAPVRSG